MNEQVIALLTELNKRLEHIEVLLLQSTTLQNTELSPEDFFLHQDMMRTLVNAYHHPVAKELSEERTV